MADNEIKIPISVEGADRAASDVDKVATSTSRLGQSARTAAPQVAAASAQVTAMGTSALAALAKTQQFVSGLGQVSNALGFGGSSMAGRVSQTSMAFTGLGAAFGPVGAAAGAVTGTLVGLLNALGPAAEAARTTAAALRELSTINTAAQQRRTSRADNERQVELAQMALALASAGITGEERANRLRERSLQITQERLRTLESELPALAVAGTRQGLTDEARADANRRHSEALAEQNRLLAEQGRLQVEGINATIAATDATRGAASGTTPRTGGGGGRNRRLDQKNKILDDAQSRRESEEAAAQAAYEAEIAAQLERQNASRQVADELMARERQQAEGLAQLRSDARREEIELISATDMRLGIDMERRDLEQEMASLRADSVDDAEQLVDFERIRLGLVRNSTRETGRQRDAAEASAQELGNYGSLLGQVFADAYGSAINGQKDFGAAFAESMKGILAQLGTKYIVEGAAALFQAVGFAFTNPPAAGTKAVEGAGLIALGAGLGAVGAAIPSVPSGAGPQEKPESPTDSSGADQNIQRTVVINYNSPVVTAGTRRQLGQQMNSLIRSGSQ